MHSPNHGFLIIIAFAAVIAIVFSPDKSHAAAGDLQETDYISQNVFKFTPDGTKTGFANALPKVAGIAFDRFGNAFVSLNGSSGSGSIIKITPAGMKTTFASSLSSPAGLAFDSDGFLYVAETAGNNVVRYAPDGAKFVFTSALNSPIGLAFDLSGNLFVSEHSSSNDVLKITKAGNRTTFATGVDTPNGLAVDRSNNVYVSTSSPLGGTLGKILEFTQAGARTTFASSLMAPYGMAFDANGNLFVADATANTILKFLPNGQRSTFASALSQPLFVAFEPPLSQPLNISTRLNVGTGDNALVGGFIATGTVGKKIVVRGMGPSLANFGIQNALQDPILELRGANGSVIASNDNWKLNDQTHQSQQALIQATGLAPSDDRESVLTAELAPGGFTAIVRGKNDTIGVGLVEIYDVNQTADSRLANISTRGFVGPSDTIIAGVIIGAGNGAAKLLVRVLGPSLAAFGITNSLKDPEVDIRDSNGSSLAINNNWQNQGEALFCPCPSQQAEIEATGLAPSNYYEAAVIVTLPVGNYTAIAKANDEFEPSPTSGVAVVEVYNLR